MGKNKIEAAEKSLRLLLGRDGDVAEELKAIRSTMTLRQNGVKYQVRMQIIKDLILYSLFIDRCRFTCRHIMIDIYKQIMNLMQVWKCGNGCLMYCIYFMALSNI